MDSINEKRWTYDNEGKVVHINKFTADEAIKEGKLKESFVHRPVKRDADGNIVTTLREDIMNSQPVQFSSLLNTLSDQFSKLVSLLANFKF